MRRTAVFAICTLTYVLSCKESVGEIRELNNYDEYIFTSDDVFVSDLIKTDSLIFLEKFLIPEDHINYIRENEMGSFVKAYRLISPLRGLDEKVYVIDDDIEISYSALDSLLPMPGKTSDTNIVSDSSMAKDEISVQSTVQDQMEDIPFHYHTINLVKGKPVINVAGINVGNRNLKSAILNSLETYNSLELGISFQFVGWHYVRQGLAKEQLNDWKSDNNIDIIITEVSGDGGLAGFPKNNGTPHDYITIGRDIEHNYGLPVAQHVVTHELGHCIGMRHTDYFNRAISCGKGGNEGEARYGAKHIPGTPSNRNIDMESVMLACYNSSDIGEFSDFDKIALKYIYGN